MAVVVISEEKPKVPEACKELGRSNGNKVIYLCQGGLLEISRKEIRIEEIPKKYREEAKEEIEKAKKKGKETVTMWTLRFSID